MEEVIGVKREVHATRKRSETTVGWKKYAGARKRVKEIVGGETSEYGKM